MVQSSARAVLPAQLPPSYPTSLPLWVTPNLGYVTHQSLVGRWEEFLLASVGQPMCVASVSDTELWSSLSFYRKLTSFSVPRTCDGITSLNGTYFMNPSYPFPFNGTLNCQLTIHKMPNVFRICQLRFDFLDFDLKRPNVGSCDDNRFMISGVNSNSFVPNICGYNTGQHSKFFSWYIKYHLAH